MLFSSNPNLAKHQEHAKNVWVLTLVLWANIPQLNVCQAGPFTRQAFRSAWNSAKSCVFSLIVTPPGQHSNGFLGESVSPKHESHMQGHEDPGKRRERLSGALMPGAAAKKASQQNYKPEKISVLRRWEQNGFCFLQDNELAHHTEQDNQCGRKCYCWWTDAIFSQWAAIKCLRTFNSGWIFMTFKVAAWHFCKNQMFEAEQAYLSLQR